MNLHDTLSKAMRSLRAHGEHELASEVADALIALREQPTPFQPVANAPQAVSPLQMAPTMDLLNELARRSPRFVYLSVASVDGSPAPRIMTHTTADLIDALGLANRLVMQIDYMSRIQMDIDNGRARP